MLLKGAGLLDGTGGPPRRGAAVRVTGERIAAVGGASDFGPEQALDVGDAWVLPGLIDMHGHLRLNHLERDPAAQIADEESAYLEHSYENLRVNLASGVTTMRCNGDRDFLDVAVRQRIADRDVIGPRLLVATRGIKSPACTGGMVATVLVDGEAAITEAIARNARRGADHIKVFVSGGVGPRETAAQAFWTTSEVQAAVAAAHAQGLKIVAHCHGGPSAIALIDAGVDTIEHGSFLTAGELDAMAQRGTYLDMTLGILLSPRSVANQHLRRSLGGDGVRKLIDEVLHTMRMAVERGVPVTLGTDTMHGMLAYEGECLASLGVSNARVVQTLTGDAAAALGRSDEFGTVREGLAADLIAVDGDPLRDITALARPRLVMARGRIVFQRED